MATLLGLFFIGVSYFATHMHLVPGSESIISQVALGVFGQNAGYYVFQIATMGILVVAANTAFADFPRLSLFLYLLPGTPDGGEADPPALHPAGRRRDRRHRARDARAALLPRADVPVAAQQRQRLAQQVGTAHDKYHCREQVA